jgi:hypothetical protein
MRRTLDPSASPLGLLRRTLAVVGAVVVVPTIVCLGGERIHEYRHPAPLGRNADAMRRHVDSVLPPGTTVDSALRCLRSLGVTTEVYSAADASRQFAGDTLFAGGPAILAVYADTGSVFSGVFGGWIGSVTLYFSPSGRLARRDASTSAASPL